MSADPSSPLAAPSGWDPALEALPHGVLLLEGSGRVLAANAAAVALLRQGPGTTLDLVRPSCHLLDAERNLLPLEAFPPLRVLRDGTPEVQVPLGLGWEDGTVVWVVVTAVPLPGGGVLTVLEDHTESLQAQALLTSRARIADLADTGTLEEVLRLTLDEAERLTGSCIGFFHFVDPQEEGLYLQTWSTRTARDFCRAEGHGMHYPVSKAGVWVEALHARQPVVHNDYPNLPNRRGLPEGHAEVLRQLVVPVLRKGRIVALMGVGNKAFPYCQRDVEMAQRLADLAWDLAEQKRSRLELQEQRQLMTAILDSLQAHVAVLDSTGQIIAVNEPWRRFARENGVETLKGTVEGVNYLQALEPAVRAGDSGTRTVLTGLQEVIAGQRGSFEVEYPCHTATVERWFRMTVVPLAGKGDGVVVSHENITERRLAEQSLERSQSRQRSMLRTAMDGVWLVDANGRFLEVNQTACRMLGRDRRELIGCLVHEAAAPLDLEGKPGSLSWVRGAGSALLRSTLRRRDGSCFPVEVSTTYLADAGHLVAYIRDITDREVAEQALRESEARFRALVEQAADGFELLDRDGHLVDVNQASCRMLGRTREELLAMSLWDVDPKVDQESFHRTFGMLPELGSITLESEHVRKDGSTFPVEVRLAPVDISGEPFVFVITRDITDRQRMEAERRGLEVQVQRSQKMDSLGSLAGGVAHDMNNVLGAIMAMSSIQESLAPPDSPLHRSMETITRACQRGRTLVQGLLGFARQGLAEEKSLDLNELVRDQRALLEHTLLQNVTLELDLAPDLRAVKGDATALSHALMNLCVNGVEAMPDGGTLTISTRMRAPDTVELVVRDTGVGMPPEVLAKATDPFFTTKPQGKGTGLGLAIVYGTVKSHRGRMDLQSHEGQGTQVVLQLPSAEPLPESYSTVGRDAPGTRTLRVLVVDDDELLRETLTSLLESMGHAAQSVASGEEALEVLQTGVGIDLVVLDLNMPGLGGAGTLPLLRENHPSLPVVLATGRASQQALDLADHTPLVTILAKPFSMNELRAHLAGLGLTQG